ncbi:TIGR04211 family SH3 domain-containing protein [Rheinheimera baltica]|uniref:TIGR04211 family SH3 domain-containing protein n=1 Tax=Rheinheimera baltica TaxID=67576 RepID=UPI00273FF4DD|nr:TIGR04211 family SH3 domain-containing protein [Rheinheimera baltica]MDP5142163.1 TIGR04211 family SH3 domain-containing protein [Rheinheimera baltica]MDP5150471.1 TIGR04211 family SH3 domain-containing protein [Rheinheimera baltica]
MFRLIKSTLLVLFSTCWLSLSTSAVAQAETKPAFISDALFVYLHSGPSNQYRIVGTLNAGQSVTYLGEDADTGYAQIQFEDNKTGWLPKEYVTYTPGLVYQLEQLKTEYANHNETVQALQQQRDQLNSELNQAVAERKNAQDQLEQANSAYEQLKVQVEATQTSVWQKPMVLGSLILLAGLIFGLVLPLIMPKRRNSERWM